MNRNWKTVNKPLVTRAELIMSWDAIDSWQEELGEMSKGKEGKKFAYPESLMNALRYLMLEHALDCHLGKPKEW